MIKVKSFQKAHLCVASSMAFRDLDLSLSTPYVSVWSSRGANGIDGTLSTALGIARGVSRTHPLIIWLGDLAAIHDLQGLMAFGVHPLIQKREAPTIILLSNNGGGGIFHHLPVQNSSLFDSYFFTPQLMNWGALCQAFQVKYTQVSNSKDLKSTLSSILENGLKQKPEGVRSSLMLIEVCLNAHDDMLAHQAYWEHIQRELVQREFML